MSRPAVPSLQPSGRRRRLVAASALLSAACAAVAQTAPELPPPCNDYLRWLPALAAPVCQAAQLKPTDGRSVSGHVLWRRDLGARARDARLRVLVIGGIHGDEASSSSLVMRWLAMAQQTGKSKEMAGIAWRFLPVLNPDGMFRPQPQRTNARGVDLNRNFPTPNWQRESRHYWEQRTGRDARRFPGPRPLSEPETRFLHDEMDRFSPQLIVSVHAPYGLLDFDSRGLEPPRKLGRLALDPLGVFPGSLGNYAGVHRDMPVVTIELAHATQLPDDAEVRAMWRDLLAWMHDRLPALAPVKPPPPPPPAPPPEPPPEPEPPAVPPEPPAVPPEPPASTPQPPASAPEAPPPVPAEPDEPLPRKPLPFGPETAPPPLPPPTPAASAPEAPASAPEAPASAPEPAVERGEPAAATPPATPASTPE